jgi:hypothetical protein
MAQFFKKDDPNELKFYAVFQAMLDQTFTDLEAYFENVDKSPALGNALWEAQSVEVWKIIQKNFFIKIFDDLIKAGYNIGSVNSYVKVLKALFGGDAVISLDFPNAGEIVIDVTAEYNNFAQWITKAGDKMLTKDGFNIVFRTLLVDIPNTQVLALIKNISCAGFKVTYNFNLA